MKRTIFWLVCFCIALYGAISTSDTIDDEDLIIKWYNHE